MTGETLIFYLAFVAGVAWYAHNRGRNPVLWGIVAAIISPLLAFLILVVMKDQQLVSRVNQVEQQTQHLGQTLQHHQQVNQSYFQGVNQQLEQVRQESQRTLQQAASRLQLRAQPPEAKASPCSQCDFEIPYHHNACPNCGEPKALAPEPTGRFELAIVCPLKTHIHYIQELLVNADTTGRIKEVEYLDMQTGGRLGGQQKRLVFVITCWVSAGQIEASAVAQLREQLTRKLEQGGYQAA